MGHEHVSLKNNKAKPILLALILTSIFLVVEAIGGFIFGSLALIADAAHMLTDVTALTIALVAIKIGQKAADSVRTFGYYRFEILAAAFNAILLFFVAIYIIYEAYERLSSPIEVYSNGMLIIAVFGLIINLISMALLNGGKDNSLNIKAAYLEVWSDMLGSIGVIIGALMIKITGWSWVDSIIGVLIGLWVLPRTWVLLKESINILLEGVPEGIDLINIKNTLCKVEGVVDIHDLHIWAITNDKISLTAHVVIDSKYECTDVTNNLRRVLVAEFGINHSTLQDERSTCLNADQSCSF